MRASTGFRRAAFMRRLAYDRGLRGCTFATAEDLRWPGYDRAYRAGARRAALEWAARSGLAP